MKIFHQAGHNTNWNIESFENDNAGDGILLSPVHYKPSQINKMRNVTKENCLFDPQFYIPDSQKKKLNSYDFFPEKLMGGFSTNDFATQAYKAAELCIDFQLKHDFQSLIIPGRYHDDLLTDYIERQKAFSVEPFLSAIEGNRLEKDIFLTLSLTSTMIIDEGFRVDLLNWITSYPEIDGVYLLVNFNESSKQLKNFEKICAYVEFTKELIDADLKVICGYCNTEGLLLSALDIDIVTMGAYENTRGFSIDKFLENDKIKRGPAPRLYFPKLLNWIRYGTAVEIKEDHPDLWEKIYTPTIYSEDLLGIEDEPHFTNPMVYKHHLALISKQYNEIRKYRNTVERTKMIREMVVAANNLYQEIIQEEIIFFDDNCTGNHLPIWNRVLKRLKADA